MNTTVTTRLVQFFALPVVTAHPAPSALAPGYLH